MWKFAQLRRRSWENLAKGHVSSARLAAAGIREIFTEILHRLAPDDQLKKSDIWTRRNQSVSIVTRRMRIEFIAGSLSHEFDALVQFEQSIKHANKFTHSFADNPEVVLVALSQWKTLFTSS